MFLSICFSLSFTISKEDLRLYDKACDAMVIPKDVTLFVGRNAEDAERIVLKAEPADAIV